MQGLSVVSLSTVLQTDKTLLIKMCFEVDVAVPLMQCFQSLENLFIEVMILTHIESP
jgi:hypothetical protein